MSNTWLILDVSNLAHRAFHTTGNLSYKGSPTGVLFGVFRDIVELRDLFATDKFVFCFDGGYDSRLKVDSNYKVTRRTKRQSMDEDERRSRGHMRRQIYRLRTRYLHEIGFNNVLWQDGFEGDDLVAMACRCLPDNDSAMVVGSDEDLFQLLSDRVSIWSLNKKRARTEQWFRGEYEIEPYEWADVKAIAGCDTDDVTGLKGVGEKTAARYLAGNLKPTTKVFRAIQSNPGVRERNIKLTKLPAEGTEPVRLVSDNTTSKKWNEVMKSLGMRSLVGRWR